MKRIKIKREVPILILVLVLVPLLVFLLYQKIDLGEEIIAEEEPEVIRYYNNYDYEDVSPVIRLDRLIVKPYLDTTVTIGRDYYDYQGEEEQQKNSITIQDNTYYQNTGIDFVSENTFDVVSISKGTVSNVREDQTFGKEIQIEHDNGLISIYQSLSEVLIKKGEIVEQGQVIGKSGQNEIDNELGNHLHFEIYRNGISVNPRDYLEKEYKKEN